VALVGLAPSRLKEGGRITECDLTEAGMRTGHL
jgi:hypothetical protein